MTLNAVDELRNDNNVMLSTELIACIDTQLQQTLYEGQIMRLGSEKESSLGAKSLVTIISTTTLCFGKNTGPLVISSYIYFDSYELHENLQF